MVPTEGVEPTHPHGYQILSLARLPIPPRRHVDPKYISGPGEVNQFYVNWRRAAAPVPHTGTAFQRQDRMQAEVNGSEPRTPGVPNFQRFLQNVDAD